MATVAKRRFIRADGPDKVTGSGRYTADLTLTGMLHAKFKFAGVTHGRITRLDTSKAEALPGVFAVATHADVPDVLYGDFVQDRYLFCKEYVRYEGDVVAAVAATTPEIAQQAVDLIEVDYEQLPVVNDLEAGARRGRAARARRLGLLRRHRRHGARRQRRLPLDDRQGRHRAGHAGRRRRHQEPLRGRRLARRADRAARDRGAVVGRPRHDLDVDAGAVRGAQRRHGHARAARQQGAHHRAAARRRLRRQVRLPLRGAHRRARAQGRRAPSGSCSRATRSSSLPTSAARAWSSRSRAA